MVECQQAIPPRKPSPIVGGSQGKCLWCCETQGKWRKKRLYPFQTAYFTLTTKVITNFRPVIGEQGITVQPDGRILREDRTCQGGSGLRIWDVNLIMGKQLFECWIPNLYWHVHHMRQCRVKQGASSRVLLWRFSNTLGCRRGRWGLGTAPDRQQHETATSRTIYGWDLSQHQPQHQPQQEHHEAGGLYSTLVYFGKNSFEVKPEANRFDWSQANSWVFQGYWCWVKSSERYLGK